jgi:hypothetical protein
MPRSTVQYFVRNLLRLWYLLTAWGFRFSRNYQDYCLSSVMPYRLADGVTTFRKTEGRGNKLVRNVAINLQTTLRQIPNDTLYLTTYYAQWFIIVGTCLEVVSDVQVSQMSPA